MRTRERGEEPTGISINKGRQAPTALMGADCRMSLLELSYIKTCFQLGIVVLLPALRREGQVDLSEFKI